MRRRQSEVEIDPVGEAGVDVAWAVPAVGASGVKADRKDLRSSVSKASVPEITGCASPKRQVQRAHARIVVERQRVVFSNLTRPADAVTLLAKC